MHMPVEARRPPCCHILHVLFTLVSEAGSLSFSTWLGWWLRSSREPASASQPWRSTPPFSFGGFWGLNSGITTHILLPNYFPSPIPFKKFTTLNKKQYFFWVYSRLSYSQHIITVLDFFLPLKVLSYVIILFYFLKIILVLFNLTYYLVSYFFVYLRWVCSVAQTSLELVSSPASDLQVCATFPASCGFYR